MDTNPIIAWVILGVVLAFFVFVAIWYIWASRNWVWPDGFKRTDAHYMGYRCTLLSNEALVQELLLTGQDTRNLAQAGAKAAWAVDTAVDDSDLPFKGDTTPELKHIVLMVLTDEDFNGQRPKDAEINAERNGYLSKVGKRVTGDYLPMILARSRFYSKIVSHGSLTLHELVHEVAKKLPDVESDDRWNHEDTRLWENHGDETIEAQARSYYLEGAKNAS